MTDQWRPGYPPQGWPPPGPGVPGYPYGSPGQEQSSGWSADGFALPPWALPALAPTGGNAKTGPLPLHPMGMGDILDGAIKLLRANIRTLALVVATFVVPCDFVIAFFERNLNGGNGFLQAMRDPTAASGQSSPSTTFAIAALTYVTLWIVTPLVCAGASRVVMASYLGGEMKAKAAVKAAFKRAPALLAATLIVHVAELVALLALAAGAPFGRVGLIAGGTIAAIGVVLSGFFVMPLFMMTAPAISLEDLGPIAGIRRSITLARRRYWPTVGIALLAGVLAYVLNQVLGLVPNLIAVVIGFHWGWLIIASSDVLVSLVSVSLIAIIATLVYMDARIRQEGFDLQVMAQHSEHSALEPGRGTG